MLVLKYSFIVPATATCLWISHIFERIFLLLKCWQHWSSYLHLSWITLLWWLRLCVAEMSRWFQNSWDGAAIRVFRNVSRWSCQNRKQEKICLVTELHRRAGKPPEAPTAYQPFLFCPFSFPHNGVFNLLFHRLQSVHSYVLKKPTLNYHNLPTIRTERWPGGRWPWRGDPAGVGSLFDFLFQGFGRYFLCTDVW